MLTDRVEAADDAPIVPRTRVPPETEADEDTGKTAETAHSTPITTATHVP